MGWLIAGATASHSQPSISASSVCFYAAFSRLALLVPMLAILLFFFFFPWGFFMSFFFFFFSFFFLFFFSFRRLLRFRDESRGTGR